MTMELDTDRATHVATVLHTHSSHLEQQFSLLVDAERASQDASLLVDVRRPLTEFLDETKQLAHLIESYVDLVVNADRYHPTDLQLKRGALEALLRQLSMALNDGVGAAGSLAEMLAFGFDDAADAETAAETIVDWMIGTDASGLSWDNFAALVDNPNLPQHVRDAVATMVGSPVLMANLQRAGWLLGAADGVTIETLELFVATQQVSRQLGNRSVFKAFDSAMNGESDNRISWDDVHRLADDDTIDLELRLLAQLIEDNPDVFNMLDTGTETSADEYLNIIDAFNYDRLISFEDVVATAVNLQAFEGRASEARDFVSGLPSPNDHRDGTGKLLDMFWFSDDGVRQLAQAALTATPSLTEQVDVIAHLPESPGGVRNLAITEYYRRLGAELDMMLNPDGDGDVLALDANGSTGANWFMHGAFASAAIRPVLVDNNGYWLVTAGPAARQAMADGNQLLFHSLAPAAAAFVETFPPGTTPTQAEVEEFFQEDRRIDNKPLFADGDRQLRDGFALMLDALADPDPATRQQNTFQANLLLGIHEQALVDPFVDRALDQGWDDGFRVVGDLFDPDESISTGQIDPNLGGYEFDADKPLPTRQSHPDYVIGQDLTTTLNPTLVTTVDINGITYDLTESGNGDVDLDDLLGWDNQPADWDLDPKNINPADWAAEHNLEFSADGEWFTIGPGSTTGVPLPGSDALPGAAANDWKNYEDRMWTISNAFLQVHTLPGMTGIPGNGFDTADLSFLPGPIS